MAKSFDSHPARYWHKLDDGRIQCDLCPRFCRLHEGQRAFCFVRARQPEKSDLILIWRANQSFLARLIVAGIPITGGLDMAEAASKVPVRTEQKAPERATAVQAWPPLESLRREVDRLFEDFDRGSWTSPFRAQFSISSHSGGVRRHGVPHLPSTSSRRITPTKSRPSYRAWTGRTSK